MKVQYIGGAYAPGQFPDTTLPEIAFLGRSNVGKSSLINTLVGQRQLARVSSTPGRTQAIHFFQIAEQFCLVDFPGYGYAKAPKSVRSAWAPLIRSYLDTRPNLKGGLLLMDVRREPRQDEFDLVAEFRERGLLLLLVVTKIDKVAKTRRGGHVQKLAKALGIPQQHALGFSAPKRLGREPLWKAIHALVGGK
jgi:GTP-binding protein